jgi:hypothetical protein
LDPGHLNRPFFRPRSRNRAFFFRGKKIDYDDDEEDEKSAFAWPISTPAMTKIIATQNVGVIGSPRQAQAQPIVLRGIRLLKSST